MGFRIPLARPSVGDEAIEAIRTVLASGMLSESTETAKFERNVAEFVRAPHAVATTSCSTALELALRVTGIGPGDEVICPAFTYPITAEVARLVGATPILADVDPETYNMRPDQAEEAITDRTKAILPVSLFGHPIDAKGFHDLVNGTPVHLIEDAACSLGSAADGKRTGGQGHLAAFSFHPRKTITCGEGGMLAIPDAETDALARSIKRFGMATPSEAASYNDVVPTFHFERPGHNWKLSDVLAAIGNTQMQKAESLLEARRQMAAVYDRLLEDVEGVTPPAVQDGAIHSYQTYACRLPSRATRDKCLKSLRNQGIEVQIGSICLPRQKAFAGVTVVADANVAKELDDTLLSLPMPRGLTEVQQEEVAVKLERSLQEA